MALISTDEASAEEQAVLIVMTDEGEGEGNDILHGYAARFANLQAALNPDSPHNVLLDTIESLQTDGYVVIPRNLVDLQPARYRCSILVTVENGDSDSHSMGAVSQCSTKQTLVFSDLGRVSILAAAKDRMFPATPLDINAAVWQELRT